MKCYAKFILVLASVFLVSCSSSDDSKEIDPVFSLPYVPVKELSDIDSGRYSYAGIKIEGQKASMLNPHSATCSRNDAMHVVYNIEGKLETMNYYKMLAGCEGSMNISIYEIFLEKEGIIGAWVTNYRTPEMEDAIPALLEIGFQGEYLRIEDRMSNFTRTKKNEKVYLYFKLNK